MSPELSATLKAIGLVILAVFIFYYFIIKEDEKGLSKLAENLHEYEAKDVSECQN